jgi:hypothetical protein
MSETHVKIQTMGCGDIITPIDCVTIHHAGSRGYRVMVRGDNDWKAISCATYMYLQELIDYA